MKKIVISVTIILTIALGIFLCFMYRREKRETTLSAQWSNERRPVEVQKARLERELSRLERNYEANKLPKGTTQIVFTDLNEKIYSICYPMMKKYDYAGIINLSSDRLPGAQGCMTREQFDELIGEGWEICIQWESGKAVNSWWPQLQARVRELGAGDPIAAYFPAGTYSARLDSAILQAGFSIAICDRGEAESPLQTKLEEGVWHLGAVGFMTSKPKNWLRDAVAQDVNVTYLVGFEIADQMYNTESFSAMIEIFNDYVLSGDLLVDTVYEVRSHYIIRQSGQDPAMDEKYGQERVDLEAQIEELKKQLSEIDARYE